MTNIVSILRNAWRQAAADELKRVNTPPVLGIYANNNLVARDIAQIKDILEKEKKLHVVLPNRLDVKIFPAAEDKKRFAVYTIGSFRSVAISASGNSAHDFGPSAEGVKFEDEIAKPLSRRFDCRYGDYGGFFQNITLAPVTAAQTHEIVAAIHALDYCGSAPEPSFTRTVRGAIGKLRHGG